MWISQKIKKDSEAKKTLREISKLIRDYSDAAKITKQKFWSAEIGRFLRPRAIPYIVAFIITGIIGAGLFYVCKVKMSDLQDWVKISLRISGPILILGITLSNAIKGIDKESRFATEYLKESCRTTMFTCLTFLTVLAGFLSILINNSTTLFASIPFLFLFSLAIGGTIWCLMSQVYVIVETIRCMNPETSTKVASNYAARKTIHEFMKKAYIDVWMGKFSELLEIELEKFKSVFHYNGSYSKYFSADDEKKYTINLPKKVDANVGFRDYSLNKLKKINKSLKAEKAKLYLAPNLYITKECGTLYCKQECGKLSEVIEKRKFCKFRRDKYVEMDQNSKNGHYLKLYRSLIKTVEAKDVAQFREYLKSIESVFNAIIRIRKNSLIRKHSELNYEKYRYLQLYIKSLKWLLASGIEEEICDLFIKEITYSIDRLADGDMKNGDWYVLDTFKWILPNIYKLFEGYKNSTLWQERARIGRFYYYAEDILADETIKLSDEQELQIKLTIHKGIVSWLLVAMKNEDTELIKDLCRSARKLVFSGTAIIFTPNELVIQHFILCGKILKSLIDRTPPIDEKLFKSLLFDEYDHSTKYSYDYNELLDFYIENRKNNPRDYLREFCETDWEESPLGGGRYGTPHYAFDGTELDYVFIYLALLVISESEQERSIEFWHYNIKDKIKNLEKAAHIIGFYDFKSKKKIFEKWMDDCDELYKEQEEQKVAEATLNPNKVSEYIDSFWAGYKGQNTFLKFCFKYSYYTIKDTASNKGRIRLPKTLFLEKTHQCDSVGRSCGSDTSKNRDTALINNIIKSAKTDNEETASNIESTLNKACQWLEEKGLSETEGIIVYCGNTYIEGELYKNEYYVPSWKNEKEKFFSGYYKNYPIKNIHNRGEIQKCIALDLREWKGIQVRGDIVDKEIFGDLSVREWSEDEITAAIKKNPELKEDDRNKLKGTCVAEYELYWQLNESNLPDQMTILLQTENPSASTVEQDKTD